MVLFGYDLVHYYDAHVALLESRAEKGVKEHVILSVALCLLMNSPLGLGEAINV